MKQGLTFRRLSLVILTCFLFLFPTSVSAAVYYVDIVNGTDDSSHGTLPGTGAWQTLHYALGVDGINDGDVLNVAAGTYNVDNGETDFQLTISRSNVAIQGASGGTSIIDSSGASGWNSGIEIAGSNVTLRSLAVQYFSGFSYAGILISSGSGNIIEGCEVHDNFDGIKIESSSSGNIVRNDCRIFGNSSRGILIDGSNGNEIYGNQVYDNGTGPTGIHIENGAANNLIHDNNIYDSGVGNQLDGISFDDAGAGNEVYQNDIYGHLNNGIAVYESSPEIRKNQIHDNNRGVSVSGGTGTASPNISNNLIYKTTGTMSHGIYVTAASGTASPTIYHNTIDGGTGAGVTGSGTTIIKYNIITNFGMYGIDGSAGTIDYNDVWNNTAGNYGGGTTPGPNDINPPDGKDPSHVLGSYELQSTSPCRDAIPSGVGDPVTDDIEGRLRPQGSGYDMGCYEFPVYIPPSYRLTVAISPEGGGSVTATGIDCPGDCSEVYVSGTEVTLTATPAPGYEFDSWSGDIASGSTNPFTFSMNSSKRITAVFVPGYTLDVTISPEGGGSITAAGIACPGDCTETYVSGTDVTLTAIPTAGYQFDSWSGDLSGSTNPETVTMDSSKSVTAVFVPGYTLDVTISPEGGGSITAAGIACPGDCTKTYVSGTDVTLTAIPTAGYQFDSWSGDLNGSANPETVTMDSSKSVTAVFVPGYTLDVAISPEGGGSITAAGIACPGDCTEAYASGTEVTLTATPAPGYAFDSWSGDLSGSANPETVTMDASKTVTAIFAANIGNNPPDTPTSVIPTDEAILSEGPVTIDASAFSDPEDDAHSQTYWLVGRADRPYKCSEYDPSFDCEDPAGALTQHTVNGLAPGMKYLWKVGYEDVGSGQTSWSQENAFKVGTSVADSALQIYPGTELADYEMASFVHWPDDPVATSVVPVSYDSTLYRIGTYNAMIGGYVEYGGEIQIEPGRAYWFLAKDGLDIMIEGVPVSTSVDIEVKLLYDPSSGDGWNMVGCPNNANYYWGDVEVLAYDAECNILSGPTAISALPDPNPYIDKRLWRWENGSYYSDTELMEKQEGYWVKVKNENISLRFPVSAHASVSDTGIMFASLLNRIKRWMKQLVFDPQAAIADSGDTPPMPMEGIGLGAEEDTSGDTDGGGGSCFVDTLTNSMRR